MLNGSRRRRFDMCDVPVLPSFLLLVCLAMAGCAGGGTGPGPGNSNVDLTILAFNDFHGNLEAPRDDYGGAAFLAAHLRRAAAASDHSVIVSAGDLIGATPLISSLFHDQPTIEAADLMDLEFNATGNHEFDDGRYELLRMQHGGAHPEDDEGDGGTFTGADFRFLAANVLVDASGETLFPAYEVVHYEGIPVAFIGLTLEGTPSVVTSSGVAGLTFRDEAVAINEHVEEIRQQGIEAIVVIIHEGGYPADGGEDECRDFRGPIVEIVEATDQAVDLFVTGHTHRQYLCRLNGRPVTSAGTAGRFFTNISARLDRASGDLTVVDFDNVPVTPDIAPAADVQALVDDYRHRVREVSARVVGRVTADLTKRRNPAGESQLGALIADAQLAATRPPNPGNAEIAFMNSGGIRNAFLFEPSGSEEDGEVTYAEVFAVHPFGNRLVTMTMTGAQLHTLLEQQWIDQPSANILMPSRGFSYAWTASAGNGARVDAASLRLDGEAIEPGAPYRVTVNSFLAGGGDGFPVLREGTERATGGFDIDALEDYLQNRSPIAPRDLNRIRVMP